MTPPTDADPGLQSLRAPYFPLSPGDQLTATCIERVLDVFDTGKFRIVDPVYVDCTAPKLKLPLRCTSTPHPPSKISAPLVSFRDAGALDARHRRIGKSKLLQLPSLAKAREAGKTSVGRIPWISVTSGCLAVFVDAGVRGLRKSIPPDSHHI